jgi:SAM-dependent methyltransferase
MARKKSVAARRGKAGRRAPAVPGDRRAAPSNAGPSGGAFGPEPDPSFREFRQERTVHWNEVARRLRVRRRWGAYYHRRLERVLRKFTRRGLRVLEIGCAEGDLLAALEPAFGLGIDLSSEMLLSARHKHPGLHFILADGHALPATGPFDIILLSDLLNDVWDVQQVLREVGRLSGPRTRIWITSYNRLWEPALSLVGRLGLAQPNLYQNWLTVEDIRNLLALADLETVRHWTEILWPLATPVVAPILNRFLVTLWPFRHLALTNVLVARLAAGVRPRDEAVSVSIVVPARNEAGTIPDLFRRLPRMAADQEVIFVEGHSRDNTYHVLEEAIAAQDQWPCRLMRQPGEGKGDAVREGFAAARGDILMILDADLTVPPEDLPRFFEALVRRKGELANGVRLVYPMEGQAMHFFNLVGNKAFSLCLSWLLGQPIKDTLCGTKALWREDYRAIAEQREYFGRADPFGDFDLLLGAARLHLKIVDIPIRYRGRRYGTTNISRWRHGILLAAMVDRAARKLRFR